MRDSLASQTLVAALTHRGAVRDQNEDAIAIGDALFIGDYNQPELRELQSDQSVVMVADGMGGHAYGGLASRTVLQTLIELTRERTEPVDWNDALCAANDALYRLMDAQPETRGMGTTVVGAVFGKSRLLHFNVGDSRAYRHSQGALTLLSHDDVPLGTSGPGIRRSHQITQSLGGRLRPARIRPHVGSTPPLSHGESLMLCSDGLTDMIGEEEIARTFDNAMDIGKCAANLFERALKRGGHDNISIVIAQRSELKRSTGGASL